MRKILSQLAVGLAILSFLSFIALPSNIFAAPSPTTDQSCTFSPSHWQNLATNNYQNQNFRPTKDRLTQVTLSLGGERFIYFCNLRRQLAASSVHYAGDY